MDGEVGGIGGRDGLAGGVGRGEGSDEEDGAGGGREGEDLGIVQRPEALGVLSEGWHGGPQFVRKPKPVVAIGTGVELLTTLGGKAEGGGGLVLLVGKAAGGHRFDGGDCGEDLKDPVGDRDVGWGLGGVVLQLHGGGGAGGEQLDEERLGELRHGGGEACSEGFEAAVGFQLGFLPEDDGDGLVAFDDSLLQGGGQLDLAEGWRRRRITFGAWESPFWGSARTAGGRGSRAEGQ